MDIYTSLLSHEYKHHLDMFFLVIVIQLFNMQK